MKHEKLKKALAIIAVVLFTLSIIFGIVFSILSNEDTQVASADEIDDPVIVFYSGTSDLNTTVSAYEVQDFLSVLGFYGAYSYIESDTVYNVWYYVGYWGYYRSDYGFEPYEMTVSSINGDFSKILINNDIENLYYLSFVPGSLIDISVVQTPVGNLSMFDIPTVDFILESPVIILYYQIPANGGGGSGDYDEGYQAGYKEGFRDGERKGTEEGTAEGYNDGYEAGYDQGYDNGVQSMQDKLDSLQAKYDKLQDDYDELQNTVDELRDQLSTKYEEGYQAGYKDGLQGSTGDYDQGYQAGWNAMQDRLQDLTDQLQSLQSTYEALFVDYEKLQERYESLLDSSTDYVDDLEELRDLIEQKEKEIDNLQSQLNSSYQDGYNNGYNKGYSEGLNLGQSNGLINPVTYFLTPVHELLNIRLFGVFSLGTALNVVLFVGIALIFIKMFAGG